MCEPVVFNFLARAFSICTHSRSSNCRLPSVYFATEYVLGIAKDEQQTYDSVGRGPGQKESCRGPLRLPTISSNASELKK